jgi:metallo-beta-lactamase family protein
MAQSLTSYGAAETVTGSRHLLNLNGKLVLVDCGLFQGNRMLRDMNWQEFPIEPRKLDMVVVTHAHLDHIGYLPRLISHGYKGPIYATPATIRLARISLPDSARLQEEDARTHNKIGGARHQPALPLYTEEDAYATMKQFVPLGYRKLQQLPGGAQFQYLPAGHILGSAFAEIYFDNGERILMSGDLGRFNTPIIIDPTMMDNAEYLVVESTYGDRLHAVEDAKEKLAQVLDLAWQTGSAVLTPSFSIGRTQEMLYYIKQLQNEGRMPRIPIYVDSPMAVSVTEAYRQSPEEFDEDMKLSIDQQNNEMEPEGVFYIRDSQDSRELNSRQGAFMVIAGSGMANGGRIVHHLMHHISNPNTIVLFTGYQAEGTLGRNLLDGQPMVRILRQELPVRARIEKLNALSAHADQGEIMHWLRGFKKPPKRTHIVHGEPDAQHCLKDKIVEELGWNVVINKWGEEYPLD